MTSRKPRLWPAAVMVAAAAAWIARTWLLGDAIRQNRVIATIGTALLLAAGLTLWAVAFSRFPGRVRLGVAVAVVAAAALGAGLFRIRGVTGDLMPILEPRWGRARESAPPLPPPRPAAAPASTLAAAPAPAASAAPEPALSAPAAAAPTPVVEAGEYPQFLGPGRDATLPGPRLSRDWSAQPPRRLWRQGIGEGWSGFAVAGAVAVTQEQAGAEERVVAYQTRTGRRLWSHADRARYDTTIAGVGPRATPTVHAGRVFTLGATGILNAFDLATGRRLWSRDVVGDNGAPQPEWGRSGSPLVVEERVVVSAGGPGGRSLVAYDAGSGEPAWAAGSDGPSYSSPAMITLAGRRQIVILNRGSVAGHDPRSGEQLWSSPFPATQPNVAVPLLLPGDRLLVSAGYGVGSKTYRVAAEGERLAASVEWESPRLKSKFANLIWHGGSVFGLDDGVLTCLDPATGERRWKGGRYGHGQLLLVGGLLLVQTEEGEIVMLEPSAEGPRELTRFQALEGKTWNPPALAGRLLLVRNDVEAAAYELPTE